MKQLTFIILILFILAGCNKQENTEKFVGFTPVGKVNVKLYIDLNTVERTNTGVLNVTFNMIEVLPNGHVIQNARTDCKSNYSASKGVQYLDNGSIEEGSTTQTLTLGIKDNFDINLLLKLACDKAEVDRVISGVFDDSKALEILYGPYQATTQTALWKVIEPPSSLDGYEKFLRKLGTVKILDSKDFLQKGETKHILLTSTSVSDASQVLLSAAVFVKIENIWHIEAEYPFLKIAKNGEPKIMQWEHIGNDHFGIIESNKYLNNINQYRVQNFTCYMSLYELTESGIKQLIEHNCYNNSQNYGKDDENRYVHEKHDISIKFTGINKEYWNATVTINQEGGQVEEIYQFQDGRYLPLWSIALKEMFGVTDSSKEIKILSGESSTVWFEQSFQYGNDSAHVVFVKTIDNSKQSWVVYAGALTYKLVDEDWKIVSVQPKIGQLESDGCDLVYDQVPIVKLAHDKVAFLIHGYGCGGSMETTETPNLYVYTKNSWNDLGNITISDVVNGHCHRKGEPKGEDDSECWGYDGKISPIQGKKDYPDLLLIKIGDELDGNGQVIKAKNVVYIFDGKSYKPRQ